MYNIIFNFRAHILVISRLIMCATVLIFIKCGTGAENLQNFMVVSNSSCNSRNGITQLHSV